MRLQLDAKLRRVPGAFCVLLWSTCLLVALTIALPYLHPAGVFGFVPLPATLMATVLLITIAYVAAAEIQKA